MTWRVGIEKEVKRRADVVGIFPGETSVTCLISAVLLEANDEWQLQHRDMQVEAMAELMAPEPQTLKLPPLTDGHLKYRWNFHHVDGRDRAKRNDCRPRYDEVCLQ